MDMIDTVPKNTTPDRLRAWMKRAGWDQGRVADYLEVSPAQVSHLVCGTRSPSLALAARIQRMANIPATDWVTDNDKAAV